MSQNRRSRARTGHINAAGREASHQRAWWIGNVRVTTDELASWQLGPDVTQGRVRNRRASGLH